MKNILNVIWIFIASYSISCKTLFIGNEKVFPHFSYELLSFDTLAYQLISPSSFKLITKSKIEISDDSYVDEKIYNVDSVYNIRYAKYNNCGELSSFYYRDFIEISNKKIIIDSFLYVENYNINTEPRTTILNAVYIFDFMERKYLCFFIQDVSNPDGLLNTNVFLFDFTDSKNAVLLLHELQASENLLCFGDFDKNEILDFASWSNGINYTEKLQLYELNPTSNKFELNKKYFLHIEYNENAYIVNKQKSRWFSVSPFSKPTSHTPNRLDSHN